MYTSNPMPRSLDWIRKERSRMRRKKERRVRRRRCKKQRGMNGMPSSVSAQFSTIWVRTVQKRTRACRGRRMWSSCRSVVSLPVFIPSCSRHCFRPFCERSATCVRVFGRLLRGQLLRRQRTFSNSPPPFQRRQKNWWVW